MYNLSIFHTKYQSRIGQFLCGWPCAISFSSIVYLLLVIGLYQSADRGAAAFSILPVAMIGLYFGAKVGFVSGVLFLFVNWLLFRALGSTESLMEFIRNGAIAGSIAVALVGAGIGFFSTLNKRLKQEITERKQIQQELNEVNDKLETQTQKALQARAQFLTAMNHKLRTPMNASMGLSTLLLETTPNMVNGDYVHDILRSNREVVGIVDSILEYTKIESGDIELNSEEFQLDKLIEHVTHRASEKAVEQNVTLHTVIDPSTPLRLIGDPKRLRLIIENLLNNALDATQDGDDVMLSFKPAEGDQKIGHTSLNIQITDTGKGIPADKLKTLFEPFSNAYESTTQSVNRAGIGAALCQSLCKKMGGEIQAKSEVDKGTTITVTLPFDIPQVTETSRRTPITTNTILAEHRRYSPNLLSPRTDQQNPIRILLVEDNILNAKVALKMLEMLGHQVEWVEDGQQAVNAVEAARTDLTTRYDLILMDIQMPRLDGIAATMQIREEYSEQALTIIALTADTTLESFSKQQTYGFNGFIGKPISLQILRDTLSTTGIPV